MLRLVVVVEVRLCPPLLVRADKSFLDIDVVRAPDVPLIIDLGPRHGALPIVNLVQQILLGILRVERVRDLEVRFVVIEGVDGGREEEEAGVHVADRL